MLQQECSRALKFINDYRTAVDLSFTRSCFYVDGSFLIHLVSQESLKITLTGFTVNHALRKYFLTLKKVKKIIQVLLVWDLPLVCQCVCPSLFLWLVVAVPAASVSVCAAASSPSAALLAARRSPAAAERTRELTRLNLINQTLNQSESHIL